MQRAETSVRGVAPATPINPGPSSSCRRKYVREEALEAQFTELLGRLKFNDEVLEWVRD